MWNLSLSNFLLVLLLLVCTNINSQNVNVRNYTEHINIEPFIKTVCEVLMIEDVDIYLINLPQKYQETDDIIYHAFIQQNDRNSYLIYISKQLNGKFLETVLAHELIHLNQFQSERLVRKSNYIYYYDDMEINLKYVEYSARHFEIDAHSGMYSILRTIRKNNKHNEENK